MQYSTVEMEMYC